MNDAIIPMPQTPDTFTTSDLAQYFERSPQTIRNWSDDVKDYLSVFANPPGDGRSRSYTLTDIRVLALVAEQRDKDQPMESIIASLATMYNANTRTFSNLPDIDLVDVQGRLENDKYSAIKFELALRNHQLVEKMQELDKLRGADLRAERLETQLDEKNTRIEELNETVLQLQKKLDELTKEQIDAARREGAAYFRGRLHEARGVPEDTDE